MPKLIALDLGAHAVKVTTWRIAGRSQLELDEHHEREVPQDGTAPSLTQRLVALDTLLHDAPGLKPGSSDVVVLAWPSNEAAFHRLTVPFSDAAQIERTLPFTIENEVPFELEDMVLAWRMAEQAPGRNDVLVALARRDRVREWLTALADRGIDPAAIHVDADLFGPWGSVDASLSDDPLDAPPAPLVAVIDVGHAHTTVSVVRGGGVQIVRSINVGGLGFTRAIAEGLQVPYAQAEALKHGASVQVDDGPVDDGPVDDGEVDENTPTSVAGDGAPGEAAPASGSGSGYAALPAAVREKVDGAMGLLLAEIRSSLIKAEDTLGSEVVEVRITGGGSRIPELLEHLRNDLGVPVVEAIDPRSGPVPPQFAVCHALAGPSLGVATVDLRVGDLVFRGRTDLVRAALGYGISGAAFFSFAALLMFAWQFRGLSVEQAQAEEAVRAIVTRSFPEIPPSSLDSMGKAEATMAQFTQDAVERADVLGDGEGGVPHTIDTLYALTKAFPPHPDVKVEVSELTIGTAAITLNAETDNYAGSAEVERRLKAAPRFHTATKGTEQKLANQHVRFPITISLVDEGEGGGEGEGGAGEATTGQEEG